jgi:hypothetical protein
MPELPKSIAANTALFVQLNDVYQIDTSADYTDPNALILPRISTLVNRLREQHEHVRFCLPGDFLAPSSLSKRHKGKQMVEVLKTMDLDLVSLGNHEFEKDISAAEFEKRVTESDFKWLSLNFEFRDESLEGRLEKSGKFDNVEFIRISDSHRLAIFGILNAKTPDHIGWAHEDPKDFLQAVIDTVKEAQKEAATATPPHNVGFTYVAMTHQDLQRDLKLAEECADLKLIMGGHDHNVTEAHWNEKCLIVKAASNARTLRLNYIVVVPMEQPIGESIPDRRRDPAQFDAFVKTVFKEQAVKPLRIALSPTTRLTTQEKHDLCEVFDEQKFSLCGRRDDQNLVLVFTIRIKTKTGAFKRLVAPDQHVQDKIEYWIGQSEYSPIELITAPVDLKITDLAVRRTSTNFGNFVADLIRGLPEIPCAPRVRRPTSRL